MSWAVLWATALVLVARTALGAEWEIAVYRAGVDLRVDRPNITPLPGRYPTFAECQQALALTVANGLRLRCDLVERRK
jgi:hypothetical protein